MTTRIRLILSDDLNDLGFTGANVVQGDVVAHPTGLSTIRATAWPASLPADGPWLSRDYFGNWSLKGNVGSDELFSIAQVGGVLVTGERGQQEKSQIRFNNILVWQS